MSYMRYPVYAWVSGYCPKDCPSLEPCANCDETMCSNEEHECTNPTHAEMHITLTAVDEGYGSIAVGSFGSIEMPLSVFDELVVMRHAELVELGMIEETIARVDKGNIGSWALRRAQGEDPAAELLERVRNEAEHY